MSLCLNKFSTNRPMLDAKGKVTLLTKNSSPQKASMPVSSDDSPSTSVQLSLMSTMVITSPWFFHSTELVTVSERRPGSLPDRERVLISFQLVPFVTVFLTLLLYHPFFPFFCVPSVTSTVCRPTWRSEAVRSSRKTNLLGSSSASPVPCLTLHEIVRDTSISLFFHNSYGCHKPV